MLDTIIQDFAEQIKIRCSEIMADFTTQLDFTGVEEAITEELAKRCAQLQQAMLDALLLCTGDPTLIQNELNRRLEAARESSPTQWRLETLNRDLIRVRKSMELLLTAYQEELLTLDELRVRMPPLRQREQAMQAELQAINSLSLSSVEIQVIL